MIKSWKKFNESKNAVFFGGSDEFKEVLNKYVIVNEDIEDFFVDLHDDRNIETKLSRCSIDDIKKDSFRLFTILVFSKTYLNQKKNKSGHIQSKDYLKFLSEQVEDIKSIQESCNHFGEVDHSNLVLKEVSQCPFQGSGQNMKDYGQLIIYVRYEKIIESSEMFEAEIKFQNKENPLKNSLDKIAKKLIKSGIRKEHASNLLDIHPGCDDDEFDNIAIGFLTNDEIIVIAYISKKTNNVSYDDYEFDRAISDYESGFCSELLDLE